MFPRRALKALRENGIMIILASGRHKIDLDELPVKDIEFDGYLALNGQLLLDSNPGIGVAMGNAGDSVKAAADYITDSVDEDGIENALRHFRLIR